MNRLNSLLYGRNGVDALSVLFIGIGCVLTFVLSILRVPYYSLISLIPYGYAAFRILSKNIEKRSRENQKFLKLSEPWQIFLKKKISQHKDKEHKYYNCPNCHNTLRVPKGRGKIKITCPHCSREFKKKT